MEEKVNLVKAKQFKVLFYGKFIPLQGVSYIVRAAKIIEQKDSSIHFDIVGNGQTYKEVMRVYDELRPANVTFEDPILLDHVPLRIAKADVVLGIFGDTDKNQRVIPNKVYEALAMGKATVTADSPAVRELLTDRKDTLLCKRANPQDLADKILQLKNDSELRQRIAKGGYEIFKHKASPQVLGRELKDALSM